MEGKTECNFVQSQFSDLIDQVLSDETHKIKIHVETCTSCQKELKLAKKYEGYFDRLKNISAPKSLWLVIENKIGKLSSKKGTNGTFSIECKKTAEKKT